MVWQDILRPVTEWGCLARTPPVQEFMPLEGQEVSGAAATTPACGTDFQELATGIGNWSFDFGFEVDDRFYSTTLGEEFDIRTTIVAAASLSSDPNKVYVSTLDSSGNGKGGYFTL